MKSILFRIIAIVVVLVLIVNLSPIRAQASALPEVAGVVTKVIPFAQVVEPAALGVGGSIFCWVAAGLGVAFTAYQAVQAYNDFQDYSTDMGVMIYYYPDGSWSYGVDVGFIERVHDFIFSSDVFNSLSTFIPDAELVKLNGYMDKFADTFGTMPFVYWYKHPGSNATVSIALAQTIPVVRDGAAYPMDGSYLWSTPYNGVTIVKSDGVAARFNLNGNKFFVFRGYAGGGYGLESDQFGEIALPGTLGDEASWAASPYSDWYANSRPAIDPDTQEEITVLPIPLNPSADPETQIGTLTQPDIWQGSVADPMPDTDPDTGTDTDPDGSLSNTPWDAVKKWASDFFIPSGDITMYSLDLTELFPFCIPFDIFDLLSALKADPVAPVFELELDLGVTKAPITVDLSGWSDLASILRILEVGLFCLGLALGTKELIGS